MSGRPFFLFAHGWGFDATLWDAMRDALPDADTAVVERGYLGAAPRRPDVPPGAILVGHSAGVLDLLSDPPPEYGGLVAINGFSRFAAAADFLHGVADRVLQRMLGRLALNPQATVAEFRVRCGSDAAVCGSLHPGRLREGLDALCGRDLRASLRRPGLRLLVLAGANDPIVPPALTRDCFEAAETIWHPAAGHLLPCTDPVWCADRLRAFAA